MSRNKFQMGDKVVRLYSYSEDGPKKGVIYTVKELSELGTSLSLVEFDYLSGFPFYAQNFELYNCVCGRKK